MHRWLHRRPSLSRSLLILALLAWIALPFDGFAHSLAMAGETEVHLPMAMDTTAASHCDRMSMMPVPDTTHAPHPAPSHPVHNGHGCCTGHSCYCASMLSSIAGAPHLSLGWEPARVLVVIPIQVAPALIHAAPLLRPPIT